MPRTQKPSPRLKELFGHTDDREVSRKLIAKLLQYNMQYEEITKVILSFVWPKETKAISFANKRTKIPGVASERRMSLTSLYGRCGTPFGRVIFISLVI
jgi:hypothetical protein